MSNTEKQSIIINKVKDVMKGIFSHSFQIFEKLGIKVLE